VKRFLIAGTLTALLLAAFLVLRPTISAIGSPAVPDTAGRATELLPEEQMSGAAATTLAPRPKPVAGKPLEAVEQQIVTLTNDARQKAGMRAVSLDESLRRAARDHARDMIERGFTDSINPDGLTADDRVSAQNRNAFLVVTENIGGGSTKDAGLTRRLTADWLSNPGDREKLLRAGATHVGVGVRNSVYEVRAVEILAQTVAVLDAPVPEKIATGGSFRAALAPESPATSCNALDVFAPETGLVVLGPVPLGNVVMSVPPGIYKVRIHCADGGGARIHPGPRIEVTR